MPVKKGDIVRGAQHAHDLHQQASVRTAAEKLVVAEDGAREDATKGPQVDRTAIGADAHEQFRRAVTPRRNVGAVRAPGATKVREAPVQQA